MSRSIMNRFVVYGPQGCGKTKNAELLRQHFGSTTVIDDWDGRAPLPEGALALTNISPPYPVHVGWSIAFRDAMADAHHKPLC